MTTITITGASDDIIMVSGDIYTEFEWYSQYADEQRYIAVSDGTLLSANYDNDGIWRFPIVTRGSATLTKVEGSPSDDSNDTITLTGDNLTWVAMATDIGVMKAKKG